MSDDAFVVLDARAGADAVYKQLLDAAPDAVVVVESGGRILFANQQAESMFGWSREELAGQAIEVLVPERFRNAHGGHRAGFFARPNVRPMGSGLDLFGRKKDGAEFPIEISLSPLHTDDGLLISASIRDTGERRAREREVRRMQGHLLSAVESIQGAFAIFDAKDALVLCNSTYRELFGRHVDGELVGRSFDDLLRAAIAAARFDASEGDEVLATRLRDAHHAAGPAADVVTAEGRRLRAVTRRTAEGGVVATLWDVTEEAEHEAELRRARTQAEAASSAKSEFLSSMSHELRTPLNAILGFAQLLERDKKTPLSDRHKERIGHVLKGGEHLLKLIDEVLDLSRIEAGQVLVSTEPVRVEDVLSEVRTTLDAMARRADVTLDVAPVPEGLPEAVADRTRLSQILMNFGSNAVKYGRSGGHVRLSTEARAGRVRVTVTDDGAGIPRDKQEKLFQPFQRLGQETGPIEGTGIGLAISKRLASLMHGEVGFESHEGEGSSFWVELPAHRPEPNAPSAEASGARADSPLTSARERRFVIVYIEDNPSNIAFMEDLVADFEAVSLLTAPTAEIGIELVRARLPDAVITDINLPGMSGFEAARRLRAWPETSGIPIVALSAAAMLRDRGHVEAAGFFRYLTKPVRVDELASVLEELLLSRA